MIMIMIMIIIIDYDNYYWLLSSSNLWNFICGQLFLRQ